MSVLRVEEDSPRQTPCSPLSARAVRKGRVRHGALGWNLYSLKHHLGCGKA